MLFKSKSDNIQHINYYMKYMDLDNLDLFSSLTEKERDEASQFFQEYFLQKWETLLNIGDDLIWIYIMLDGQIIVSNKDGYWIWFINKTAIIWASIIYDYSKKHKENPVTLTVFKDSSFLIIPIYMIQSLTDKDRSIFNKILEQIKVEKRIF